ncbi:MAG: nitronate monooxygenase [Dehalococcoidia bacterium]|nr:nitronate monooxygenase [Dehalococcoidia bacterium]
MFKTRVTEILGIEYPIIQGGMMWVSCPKLAAAVSNAGGLGILVSAAYASGKELREDIRKTKSLTDKPFGVNLSLFPAMRPLPNEEYIEVLIEEGVPVVETSGFKAPDEYLPRLREGNVKVIHKCAAVKHAQTAERVGVDMVAVVGVENGGATGMVDVTTFVLVPATVNALSLPVIAGGGVADARGFVAALALGAEGVVIGTRFMATHEAPLHPKFKKWLLRSKETDTTLVMRSIRNTHRVLKNKAAEKALEMEQRGATLEELATVIGGGEAAKAFKDGELEAGIAGCGQVVGLIDEIVSTKEVIDGIVAGAGEILQRLEGTLTPR